MFYENSLLTFLQNNGMTQSDLSLGSRISNVSINKICRKKLSPSLTLVGKISKYLIQETNCTAEDLKQILPPYVKKEKIVVEKEVIVKEKEAAAPKKEKVSKAKPAAEVNDITAEAAPAKKPKAKKTEEVEAQD